VLGQHAGDVVVHHDHLVDMAEPLLAKMPTVAEPQPTRMRSSGLPLTIGARPAWTVTPCTASMVELDRLAAAERQQHVTGCVAFLLGGAGQ
jgi:hypothetical protein